MVLALQDSDTKKPRSAPMELQDFKISKSLTRVKSLAGRAILKSGTTNSGKMGALIPLIGNKE